MTFVYNCIMFTSLLHLYTQKTTVDLTQFEDKDPRSNCTVSAIRTKSRNQSTNEPSKAESLSHKEVSPVADL